MKKVKYFMMLLSGIGAFSIAIAQKDSSGIYATADDFQQGRLSYAINYKTGKHKIKDNMLFQGDKVKVVHDGQTYTMDKDKTYGFKNTKGEVFRFIDSKEYQVLNPDKPMLLYVYNHPSHSPKETAKYVPAYFFSTHVASSPQPLTKANLKAAYPEDHKFHDELDAQFKDDGSLYAYDNFHKMYKLDWVVKNDKQ